MSLFCKLAAAAWLVISTSALAQSPPPPFAIELKAVQTVSSADAVCGQTVLFSTIQAFAANGQEFAAGSLAAGRVIQCKPSGRVGRGGLLEIRIEEIQLPDGHTFPISGVAVFRGGSRNAGVAGGAVAAGLLIAPYVAPAALLLRGKAAIMPAGTLVVATMASPLQAQPPLVPPQAPTKNPKIIGH